MIAISIFSGQYIWDEISSYGGFLLIINFLLVLLCLFFANIANSWTVFWILFIVANLALLVFYYYNGWKFERIFVTEDEIIIEDLFTKKCRQINYDEIIRLQYDYQVIRGSITKYKHRYLILQNQSYVVFNNYTYKNFNEIENCILENWKEAHR